MDFNPRSPCGERLFVLQQVQFLLGFQSTLPMRGATNLRMVGRARKDDFNPRSPCGERRRHILKSRFRKYFNPRSPCGERHGDPSYTRSMIVFQSTLPMRGATGANNVVLVRHYISIHAPHAGSDNTLTGSSSRTMQFQSTLPMRGATLEERGT